MPQEYWWTDLRDRLDFKFFIVASFCLASLLGEALV